MMITLLVILICLGLDYGLKVNSRYRLFNWFNAYENQVLALGGDWVRSQPWVTIAALIVPFAVVLCVLQWVCGFSRITHILFSIAVLWFCLSTCEWRDMILSYLQSDKDTDTGEVAELLTDGHADEATIAEESSFANKLKNAIFWQAHEQVLAIIFWFVILGPIGAALYRFIWLMCHRSSSDVVSGAAATAISQVHDVAAWIPARVTALTYCLVGNWHPSWGAWAKNALRPGFSRGLLVECGNLAIESSVHEDKQKVRAALSLVTRALIAWLLVLLLAVVLN
jgi:membrane protein required for beta-lactamase induction